MHERDNILRIFQETKKAVERGDAARIKELSNETTNTASLTHDPDNIGAAVVVYALSKIIDKKDYKSASGWQEFYDVYINSINKIIDSIKNKDDSSFDKNIKAINKAVDKLSGKLKTSIQEVFTEAKIDKASKIYEHGISMEKTANLLGVTLYDLAKYTGEKEKKTPNQSESKTINVKSRIRLVEDIFG